MLNRSFPTKEEIVKARDADLLEFIKRCGEDVIKSGPQEYCLAKHDSLKISHNKWCWHSRDRIGGSCIDFAMHYPEKDTRDFNAAVYFVLDTMYGRGFTNSTTQLTTNNLAMEPEIDRALILPKRSPTNNRVLAYLNKTRCIDKDIIWDLMKKNKLYESAEGHNCVFVGYDKNCVARYGFNRGTFSDKKYARDCPGSSKDYGFSMEGKSDTVYVFESPIDAMSHATLTKLENKDYTQDHRISLGGVASSSLIRYLKDNPNIKRVVFCLDNDETGRSATVRIRHQLSSEFRDRQLSFDKIEPAKKDFNEDLQSFFERQIQNGRVI